MCLTRKNNTTMFTFKTDKPTGKYRSFYRPFHYIKLNKKKVGSIDDKSPHFIRLQVIKKDINEDGNPNCEWKWICLKKQFQSVDEAKAFLKEKFYEIIEKFDLK